MDTLLGAISLYGICGLVVGLAFLIFFIFKEPQYLKEMDVRYEAQIFVLIALGWPIFVVMLFLKVIEVIRK